MKVDLGQQRGQYLKIIDAKADNIFDVDPQS